MVTMPYNFYIQVVFIKEDRLSIRHAVPEIYRVSHKFVLTFDVPRKEGKFYIMTFSYHAMCSSENV